MIKENAIPDRDEGIDGYEKIDRYNPELIENLSAHYQDILKQIGEVPSREGLLKTPERIAKALLYLTQGYDLDAKEIPEHKAKSLLYLTQEYNQNTKEHLNSAM